MNILSRISIPCVVLMSASLSNLTNAAYSQLISFGDSLSDRGNVFLATSGASPAAPYDNGQFSNGDVWTARVASALGVTSAASLSGGTNYAYGGARTFTGGGGLAPMSAMQPQVVCTKRVFSRMYFVDARSHRSYMLTGHQNHIL